MLLDLVEHLLSGLVLYVHGLSIATCITGAHQLFLSLNLVGDFGIVAFRATDIFLYKSMERWDVMRTVVQLTYLGGL